MYIIMHRFSEAFYDYFYGFCLLGYCHVTSFFIISFYARYFTCKYVCLWINILQIQRRYSEYQSLYILLISFMNGIETTPSGVTSFTASFCSIFFNPFRRTHLRYYVLYTFSVDEGKTQPFKWHCEFFTLNLDISLLIRRESVSVSILQLVQVDCLVKCDTTLISWNNSLTRW